DIHRTQTFTGRRHSPDADIHRTQTFTGRRHSPDADIHRTQTFTGRRLQTDASRKKDAVQRAGSPPVRVWNVFYGRSC
ncbi:MAG: hypothetical protein J6J31_10895, partial [Thermoguttaceae bacterium]|nr:hypothetical protein [Thermoguttaceae bacterium]